MKTFNFCIIGLLFIVLSISCTKEKVIRKGVAPIYILPTDFSTIRTEEPRVYENLGNIVSLDNYILINEVGKGIHVIDNTDPLLPINLYFWNIPGNSEFTIKDGFLYADNSIHLLVIDIHDYSAIKVLNYTENIFLDLAPFNPRPTDYVGYFYCVEKSKGVHIGWTEVITLEDPLCEAF